MVHPGHQRGAVASYSWAVNVEPGTNGLGEFHPTGRRVPSGRIRISVGAHGVDCQPGGRCRTSSLVRSRSKASFRYCVILRAVRDQMVRYDLPLCWLCHHCLHKQKNAPTAGTAGALWIVDRRAEEFVPTSPRRRAGRILRCRSMGFPARLYVVLATPLACP